jgi:hypothetical protein
MLSPRADMRGAIAWIQITPLISCLDIHQALIIIILRFRLKCLSEVYISY